ncbi:hypothetical protein Pcinc_014631 [Petrolisthes cinctipes]|uniref:Uncharacterized protein n=1 Tax=Petrolisthes cinctipes TaxID=88211 RepID=A0AAE1FUJ4_PETCI|nr:hypothetical protein Pcinc_014631 [Petrolisthes cinctipes]
MDWGAILTGCADGKARAFTERLKSSQHQHVPHRQYTSRPTDQPWFGVAGFLDKRGLMTLYKAQVRPHLEYGGSDVDVQCCNTPAET